MLLDHLPALLAVVPLVAALALPLAGAVRPRLVYPLAVGAGAVTAVLSLLTLERVLTRGVMRYHVGGWPPPWGIELVVDHLSAFVAVTVSGLAALALLYAGPAVRSGTAGSPAPFFGLSLLYLASLMGIVVAGDLFNLFVFLEVASIASYALVASGGGRALMAAFRYILLGTVGASFYLLGVGHLYLLTGTLNMADLSQRLPELAASRVLLVAVGFLVIGLGIKRALVPLHGWLPDAHTEAPTAGSMILAGVLLKLGAYGFLRLVLPLYPQEAHYFAGWLAFLATMAIIFGALASYGQDDFKRLVAYSSVNHMGFVVLGIAVAAWARGAEAGRAFAGDAIMAANGAVLQMFNHGLSSAGMFLLVGVIYDRTHTRNLNDFGGLFPLAPVYGGILMFTSMASLGLPGLGGFVSEFMVVRGAWPVFTLITALAMIGLLMTGAYILKGIGKVLHGPLNTKWVGHKLEISPREVVAIAPLLVLMLVIGVWPGWLVNVINEAVTRMMG